MVHFTASPSTAPAWLRIAKAALCAAAMLALAGCQLTLFHPQGDIGVQESRLILIASGLMLLVVVPVICLTLYFAWRYRATNTKATYAPTWQHSTRIEVVIWTIPCVIVAILAALIWHTTAKLDPFAPIASRVAPVRVQVVALNWKWLFIYPDLGVASVNELQIPTGTPIAFSLTAESLMNSFFIPQLGSQVYAMAGMQTQLHLIADHAGVYDGMSSAYSGAGFSGMHFKAVARSRAEFDAWIAHARQSPRALDAARYAQLEQASEDEPVAIYSTVARGLFAGAVEKYMGDADGVCRAPGDPRSVTAALATAHIQAKE